MGGISGTRLRVSLENISRSPIPAEYHYDFRNLILDKIQKYSPELSSAMHDDWRSFFSFSGFLGKQVNTPLGLVFRNVDVVFASPNPQFISALKNCLIMKPKLLLSNCEIYVNSVKEIVPHIPDGISSLTYETLGEIVIKKKSDDNKTIHVGIDDDVENSLQEIITRQFSAFTRREQTLEVTVTDRKQKKKAIVKDGKVSNSFIALRLKFNLIASQEVHAFVLTQGIGHHRKMGFGMVGITKEIKK
jgi:CRISPR-associated endoribonuclease Cas6